MKDRKMDKVTGYISKTHFSKMKTISMNRSISLSRLVSIAIDNEFSREVPFEFNFDLPEEEVLEYAYADQAGKILDYLKKFSTGAPLDMLLILRHDIGIENKEEFLFAFKELLDKEMIESYKPRDKTYIKYPEGYFYYRVAGSTSRDGTKIHRESKQYEQYLKLKKKFEKKGE